MFSYIKDMARKYSLPIIDLSRTFNPHSSKDYGTTPIEPSNKSGEYIAELVLHVIENFNFGSNEAKVYHKSGLLFSEARLNYSQ